MKRGRVSQHLRPSLLVLVLLFATSSLVSAQGSSADRTPEQVRELYLQVRTDPTYLAFKVQLRGNLDNRQLVDRYLTWMPLSPREMLEADMHERKYEIVIPRIVQEWHLRWLELHGQGGAAAQSATDTPPGDGGEADPGTAAPAPAPKAASVGTNRNVAADGAVVADLPLLYQGEIQVMVNPNDPSQIVAAANTFDETVGGGCGDFGLQAVFYSSDGGASWGYTCPPDDTDYQSLDPTLDCSALGGGTFGSDPAVYWDDQNNVFLNYLLICYDGTDFFLSVVTAKSSDGGATWAPNGVTKNSYATGDLEDKNFYIVDNNAGSPFHGRHYNCWDRNNDELLARSTDGGVTWTEADLPTTAGSCRGTLGRFDLGCEMAVGDNGTVYVIYDTLACGVQFCNCEQMYFSKSTDGGATWSSALQIGDFNVVSFSNDSTPPAQDVRGINPMGAIDVDNTGGACDGTLYVTYGDHGGGGSETSDIFVIRSTNDGATWSAPVQVNDDGAGGSTQFHPFLVVDPSTGDVVVAWHDTRDDVDDREVNFFVARSTDCGLSFEANVQASAPSGEFNNSTISFSDENSIDNPDANGNQYGEYMGLDARGGKAYLAWTDTRHYFPAFLTEPQDENVGFAVVDFGTPVCNNDGICETGEDCNNCPNDCISGGGATCGNGICEAGDGEDCVTCPADCNGVQSGKPANRFCCGSGGTNPVGCGDSRCTTGGFQCTETPAGEAFCCGDGLCTGLEDNLSCSIDCP